MELYVIDNKTLDILSVCNVSDYNLNLDEETNGISEFVLPNLNSVKKGYYLVLNGLYKQFLFVVSDDIFAIKGEKCVTVPALDISNIFDRKIILNNKERMQNEGIEIFIADNILGNFANVDDSIFNLNYIDVYIHTNTKANIAIDEEDGLYNFHTFLINCRQYKNIYTDFKIENKRLRIDISYKLEETMLIDTTLAEVTNYNKIYEVDPVTKVEAYIREDGSIYNLYLRNDRTTTTNKNDANRIFGRIETISCDTLENAKEESLNRIKANTYTHLVEFSIAKTSKLVDVTQLYIGRPIKIKTEDSIYDSYISAITLTDENFVSFKSGNLRIDFTDKQRQEKRNGTVGTKLDVSGGTITGDLKVEGNLKINNTNLIDTIKAKLPLAGGTMTGQILSTYSNVALRHTHPSTSNSISFGVGSGGTNRGIYDNTSGNDNWMIYRDSNNNLILQATQRNIYLKPNTDSTNQIYIDTNGLLHSRQIIPSATATYALGSNSYVYSNVYSKNFSRAMTNATFGYPVFLHGEVSITPSAANTPTGIAITFSKTFDGTPKLFTTAKSTVPGTIVLGTSAAGVSSTGATIYVTRTSTTSTGVWWFALY